MISVERIVNDIFTSNCYIISKSEGNRILIIDPGSKDCTMLMGRIGNRNVEYVLITHGHFDHMAGVNCLRKNLNFNVIASAECIEKMMDSKKNLSFYSEFGPITTTTAVDIIVDSEITLKWGKESLRIFQTPGHSKCGICMSIGSFIFTGDTLLNEVSPLANKLDGDTYLLKKSIQFIIDNYPAETSVFPGHGSDFFLSNYTLN